MEVEDHCDQKKKKGKCKREKEKEGHELWNRDSDGSNGFMGIIFKADGDEIRRRNRRSDGLRNLPDIERQAFFCFLYLSSLLVFFSLITEETRYIYIYIYIYMARSLDLYRRWTRSSYNSKWIRKFTFCHFYHGTKSLQVLHSTATACSSWCWWGNWWQKL